MPTTAEIIARIDTQIYDIINDPSNIQSYRIGDKQVSKVDAIRELRLLRQTYKDIGEDEPYEDIRHIALDFGRFGEDESELIGDEEV